MQKYPVILDRLGCLIFFFFFFYRFESRYYKCEIHYTSTLWFHKILIILRELRLHNCYIHILSFVHFSLLPLNQNISLGEMHSWYKQYNWWILTFPKDINYSLLNSRVFDKSLHIIPYGYIKSRVALLPLSLSLLRRTFVNNSPRPRTQVHFSSFTREASAFACGALFQLYNAELSRAVFSKSIQRWAIRPGDSRNAYRLRSVSMDNVQQW